MISIFGLEIQIFVYKNYISQVKSSQNNVYSHEEKKPNKYIVQFNSKMCKYRYFYIITNNKISKQKSCQYMLEANKGLFSMYWIE